MSLLHPVLPQRHHQGQVGSEGVHFSLHLFTDVDDLRHGFLLEVPVRSDDVPETLFDELLRSVGIYALEGVVHPYFDVSVPPVDYGPESVIGSELLSDLLQP